MMRNKQLGNVDEKLKRMDKKLKHHEEEDDDRFMKIKKKKKNKQSKRDQLIYRV